MKKLIIFAIIVSVSIGIVLIFCRLYKPQKNEKETLTNESSLELNSENANISTTTENQWKNGDIIVKANEYGGFEKVGNLGFSLPKNDTYITTSAGDIVLYQGNQISLFYNSNSWNYTRIGKIQNVSEIELKNVLGKDDVDIILCLN